MLFKAVYQICQVVRRTVRHVVQAWYISSLYDHAVCMSTVRLELWVYRCCVCFRSKS